jgi:hypothetical protein
MSIPQSQVVSLNKKINLLNTKEFINYSFITSAELPNNRSYFSGSIGNDLVKSEFQKYNYKKSAGLNNFSNLDILILTAHGNDLSSHIFKLKESYPDLIIVTWFFDNHLSHLNNYKTAIATDIFYPSHSYCKDYLFNPCSFFGADLPACSAQWSRSELDFEALISSTPRKSKLFLNYVDYKWSWRSQILNNIKSSIAEAEVIAMDPKNRDRYFTLSQLEKFQEWCSYKSTIIMPVDKDLSTRVFDALLAGQILIVPSIIKDFDLVIPKAMQNELGIIRITDLSLSTIKLAAIKSFEIFDQRGYDGVAKRLKFVLDNHMFKNRVESILLNIESIASGKKVIRLESDSTHFGLSSQQIGD